MSDQKSEAKVIVFSDVASLEVAERDFKRFVDKMDLDIDESGMDADDLKVFKETKEVILRAIRSGHLGVDEAGQPVLKPRDGGEPITFREPKGSNFMATDLKKMGHNAAKQIALMAGMTGQQEGRFQDLGQRDLKICNAIVALFLG